MKRLLCKLVCLVPLLTLAGCGSSPEQPPPEKAPEMTPEETQNMEKQMEEMRKMHQKG